MAIGTIVGIILAIAAIGFGIGAFACLENDRTVGKIICIILVIACAIGFITVPFSFHTVKSGQVAVVRTLGKITDTREAGTHFDFWVTKSYQKYNTKVQNVDITTAAYSSDAQTMNVIMTLQYQIMPDKVVDIATQYGSLEVLQSRIQSIVVEKTKSTLSSYKAMDIISNRSSISPKVEEVIKTDIGDTYFVTINAVVITDIEFTEAFEKAVEDKMIAEQNKLKADFDNETKVAQAKAEADAKLASAQAEIEISKAKAEAKKIEAEAQAEANKKLAESLTDSVLDSKFYDKWDGKMPSVLGEGSAILDIR